MGVPLVVLVGVINDTTAVHEDNGTERHSSKGFTGWADIRTRVFGYQLIFTSGHAANVSLGSSPKRWR